MTKINELYAWKDPGFTEGSVEVPKLSSLASLPAPDWFNQDALSSESQLNPSKGRLFDVLKIKVPYLTAKDWSYLKIVMDFNNPSNASLFTFYAFVDSVEVESDTVDYPSCVVRFHIDYWRTYAKDAIYGSGLVTRRARSEDDPVQNLPYRFRQVTDEVSLNFPTVGSEYNWLIVCHSVEDPSSHQVTTHQLVMPISDTVDDPRYWKLRASDSEVYRSPSLNEIIEGEFDEKLGIPASAIAGAFVSAIPPLKVESGTGSSNDPYIMLSDDSPSKPVTEYIVRHGDGYVDTPLMIEGWLAPGGFTQAGDWIGSLSDGSQRRVYHEVGVGGGPANARSWWVENIGIRNNRRSSTPLYSGTQHNDYGSVQYDKYVFAVDDLIRGITGGSYEDLPDGSYIVFDSGYCSEYTFTISGDDGSATPSLSVTISATTSSGTVTRTNGAWGSGFVVFADPGSFTWHLYTPVSETYYQYRVYSHTHDQVVYGAVYSRNQNYWEYPISVNNLKTTETKVWTFTDRDGTPLGTIPWGMTCAIGTARCVVTSTSAYIQFRFSGLRSSVEGLQFTAPLPAVDIASNSWSDYLYSGQREYDVESRKLANEISLAQGLVGALGQGATGAMLGGLRESQSDMPTLRSTRNSAVFAGLGAGAGALGAGLDYMVRTSYNDRLQSLEDEKHARQIDALIMPGSGWDWLFHGRDYMFVCLTPDGYSLDRYESQVALNGVSVQEPTASCDTLIKNASGPLAIENLVVRGNIPVEAKRYIKQKLNDGVRLI